MSENTTTMTAEAGAAESFTMTENTLPAGFPTSLEQLAELIAINSASAAELRTNVRKLVRIFKAAGATELATSFEMFTLHKYDAEAREAINEYVWSLMKEKAAITGWPRI